jgi:V-type H+-transporting ATPase subunit D
LSKFKSYTILLSYTPHRLKKVQGKKKRDAAAAEELKRKLAIEAGEELAPPPTLIDDEEGPGNLLAVKDEDVIF